MNIEALWAVYFGDAAGQVNGGVVVFETSRIFGGDSKFYYTGEYHISGKRISARITATHYHGDRMTAFGFPANDPFKVEVSGQHDGSHGDTIVGKARLVGQPAPEVGVVLQRLADLP